VGKRARGMEGLGILGGWGIAGRGGRPVQVQEAGEDQDEEQDLLGPFVL
jgi:hypothetical protein